jgi:hypothetical protein
MLRPDQRTRGGITASEHSDKGGAGAALSLPVAFHAAVGILGTDTKPLLFHEGDRTLLHRIERVR